MAGENNREQRAEVVRRRLEFEENPEEFAQKYEKKQKELSDKIVEAQNILKSVTYDNKILMMAATLSIALDVDGHRADITMIKTAMTIAAFHGRTQVNEDDLKQAAVLVLPHRMRKNPFDNGVLDAGTIDKILSDNE